MNSSALTVFHFHEDHPARTAMIDGDLWWVAADVCKILDHSDVSMAISRLDDDEKGTSIVCTPGGNQSMLCVNESGLYHLIFTSRKPEAQQFRRWVTHEVLPAIRRTGRYEVPGHPRQLPSAKRARVVIYERVPLSHEQEKALALRYVQHIWRRFGKAVTANLLAGSYIKRLSREQAQALLEELAAEGQLVHFATAHTELYGGKFKPAM